MARFALDAGEHSDVAGLEQAVRAVDGVRGDALDDARLLWVQAIRDEEPERALRLLRGWIGSVAGPVLLRGSAVAVPDLMERLGQSPDVVRDEVLSPLAARERSAR